MEKESKDQGIDDITLDEKSNLESGLTTEKVNQRLTKELYQQGIDDIILDQKSNLESGLTTEEVNQRLATDGQNKLDDVKKRPLILKFIDQLKDFMILILFAASLISMFTGDIAEGFLIIGIVILNAVLGVFQEAKAEKALESIKSLSSPHIMVLRDGEESEIDVKDLVIGDIVLLEAGDYIPADLRLIESINLKIDESTLTGEAVPVEKTTKAIEQDEVPLGDRFNLAFMGTVVTYGRGKAIVVKTGMDTEIGNIAKMLTETDSVVTPLQRSINQLGKILAIIALAITAIIFIIEIAQGFLTPGPFTFDDIKDAFTFAVALAVAAIPEGLPAIITVVLSFGMTNLVKQKAIMKNLPSVETLGSTNIICSDKTGTLTQNVMTIQKVYINDGKHYEADDELKITKPLNKMITYGLLVNDVKVKIENDNVVKFGDPTEIAFIDLGIKYGVNPIEANKEFKRVYELPFDSGRKIMTTVNVINGKTYAIVKGAPDVVLSRSINFEVNGKVEKLTTGEYDKIMLENNNMADQALRVLAVAYKELKNEDDYSKYSFEDIESDLTVLGLVGMIDPERPEVTDAIALCDRAGITTIMITGDHKNTAVAIAKKINILKKGEIAITGAELDKMSDEEFLDKIHSIKVYARVSPENKVRIVKTWRSLDQVVAMTGDGVNDAPSIKQADIGIAMGITGTEVAKGAADMVLTDDNFATIVNAVAEGRGIFANIKKAIHFLLSCNVGEIIAMFLGVTVGMLIFNTASNEAFSALHVLTAVQILWVNLVTDSLMAIALGLEHREPDIMDVGPRDSTKSIFSDGLGKRIAWQGLMVGLLTFAAFAIGWYWGGSAPATFNEGITDARTMAFMVLSLSQLFHAFNARSEKHSNFKLKVNKKLIYAFFISFALQMIVILTPATRKLFEVSMPNIGQWTVIILLSIAPLVIVELQKLISSKLRKNRL